MIVEKIGEYLSTTNTTVNDHLKFQIEKLAGYAFQRQFMTAYEEKPGILRLSSAGKCPRALAYKFHAYEKKGKEMDARGKIVFFQGDLVELMVMSLARLSGISVIGTGLNQIPVYVNVGEIKIEGHPDGFVVSKGVRVLECKSMASYAYDRFEKGEIDPGYLAQMNMYMEGSGLDETILVAVNKDNGVMGETLIAKSKDIVDTAKAEFELVLKSTKDKLPNPPVDLAYDTKTGLYPWNCLYCAYWGLCRTNAEKVLIKTTYKLQEKGIAKEPKEKK